MMFIKNLTLFGKLKTVDKFAKHMKIQLTNKKQCPICGSLHAVFIGTWAEVKYDDDIPRGNFFDNDSIYWCEGNECNAVFALRKNETESRPKYSSYI